MHTLLLTPQDTLFFRDGRPMEGSLSGHTAAWPAPHIASHALHAALHRAEIASHQHHTGNYRTRDHNGERNQKYGSLLTAGPFPVDAHGNWYFPAPADLAKEDATVKIGVAPVPSAAGSGSLPMPLTHALASVLPPAKDNSPGKWLRADAYAHYLRGEIESLALADFQTDAGIGDFETSVGIGIDPETQTQDGIHIYSAHYLRLRDGWKLGILAEADDKAAGDLIKKFLETEQHLIMGGQQGVVRIEENGAAEKLPFPCGSTQFTAGTDGKVRLKWVLLTPAIFPEPLNPDDSRKHAGGWLPNWIDAKSGAVLLKQKVAGRGECEPRDKYRARVQAAGDISAKLIAAKIGAAVPVTGYRGIAAEVADATSAKIGAAVPVTGYDLGLGTAKPIQLAVPAGSIYYFECENDTAARQLAAALEYPNRRSTLLGEKGYGLGLCTSFSMATEGTPPPSNATTR